MKAGESHLLQKKILLLEKDPGLAHVMGLVLRQAGCLVRPYLINDEAGLLLAPEWLQAEGVDLIIADLAGCEKYGENLLPEIRAAADLLPVIVIFPYGHEQNRSSLDDRPGCYFLSSPIEAEELRTCLTQAFITTTEINLHIGHNG